jgi:hypothetical protein
MKDLNNSILESTLNKLQKMPSRGFSRGFHLKESNQSRKTSKRATCASSLKFSFKPYLVWQLTVKSR